METCRRCGARAVTYRRAEGFSRCTVCGAAEHDLAEAYSDDIRRGRRISVMSSTISQWSRSGLCPACETPLTDMTDSKGAGLRMCPACGYRKTVPQKRAARTTRLI